MLFCWMMPFSDVLHRVVLEQLSQGKVILLPHVQLSTWWQMDQFGREGMERMSSTVISSSYPGAVECVGFRVLACCWLQLSPCTAVNLWTSDAVSLTHSYFKQEQHLPNSVTMKIWGNQLFLALTEYYWDHNKHPQLLFIIVTFLVSVGIWRAQWYNLCVL